MTIFGTRTIILLPLPQPNLSFSYCFVSASKFIRNLTFLLINGLFFLTSHHASAQPPTLLVSGSNEFGHIADFEPDPNIEGNFKLLEEGTTMSLYLDGTKDPYNIARANINLLDHAVLLTHEGSTVYIEPRYVDSLEWENNKMINSKHLSTLEPPDRLLFLLHSAPSLTLYKEAKMELLPPTYNKTLQVGNKNYTMQSATKYFLLDRDGALLQITKNLKEFKKESYFATLKKRVKTDAINFKDEADMFRFIDIVAELYP